MSPSTVKLLSLLNIWTVPHFRSICYESVYYDFFLYSTFTSITTSLRLTERLYYHQHSPGADAFDSIQILPDFFFDLPDGTFWSKCYFWIRDVHYLNLTGFEVLTTVKIQVKVFWDMTPCCVTVGYERFGGPCCFHHPEDRGSLVVRNVGILQQHYTSSHPRRPRTVPKCNMKNIAASLYSTDTLKVLVLHEVRNCCVSSHLHSDRPQWPRGEELPPGGQWPGGHEVPPPP
jgi:hypothetical protein